jgi:DNA mismatch repair protein MutS
MMKQYEEAKRACPDALLLFRMGDFYEMFHDDAKTAARVLNLALTSRDKGENGTPMAGFPYHQLESYLGKLIAAGFRAAVCEQVEDPKLAKGLVKREVTRVVTPGTITDDALLDPRESNYLAAVSPGDPVGLAWVEISTGRFVAAHFPAAQLADQLARIAPAECLLPEDSPPLVGLTLTPGPSPGKRGEMLVTRRPGWAFALETARQNLLKHFHANNLEGFGFGNDPGDDQALRAAGGVIDYLNETQKTSLEHIDHLQSYRSTTALEIDEASRRSLEITRTIREGRRDGSLLAVLDRTVTAMGSRLLADWLANPLIDVSAIQARQEAVAEFVADSALADHLHETLRKVYDVQRLLARVTTGRASPRDLSFLGRTLRALPGLKAKLTARARSSINSRPRSISVPTCAAGLTRAWPTTARYRAATAALSATATTSRWMPCGNWPTAASSGSPATRPKRASGRAFPPSRSASTRFLATTLKSPTRTAKRSPQSTSASRR